MRFPPSPSHDGLPAQTVQSSKGRPRELILEYSAGRVKLILAETPGNPVQPKPLRPPNPKP